MLQISNSKFRGTQSGDVVTFNPRDATGDDQKILNTFYYCCYMHDFFYLLGFDEAAGNFQDVQFAGPGAASDLVIAWVYGGRVNGTATMTTPTDGLAPIMKMGLLSSTNRHTAFSADVVFHEFTHGVTNRCVGGRLNAQALAKPQSRSMGEGWSDFFALTVQNYYRQVEQTALGTWLAKDKGGIRGYPYDDNFPGTFHDMGRGRYTEVHNVGEIWCATLMSLNRLFVEKFGKDKGYNLTWRLVFDGLQTTPADPSFLDARDEIYDALDDLLAAGGISSSDCVIAKDAAKKTFAKYGMGPRATSWGPSLYGVTSDFSI